MVFRLLTPSRDIRMRFANDIQFFVFVAAISPAGRDRHSAYCHLARRGSLRYSPCAHRHLQSADARDDHLARDPRVQARAKRDRGSSLRRRLRALRDLLPDRAADCLEVLIGAIVFSFVLVWNEFLIALMLTTSDAKTLPVVASEMTQLGRDVPWGILNASVILLSLPPLLFLGVLSSFLNSALKTRNQG